MPQSITAAMNDVKGDSVALYGNDTLTQLGFVLDELRANEKYNMPPEKLDKAFDACLEGRVAHGDIRGSYRVRSAQEAEGSYDTRDGLCTCKWAVTHPSARYGCYHGVAAVMFARWQQNITPLALPLPQPAVAQEKAPMALEAPTIAQETTLPVPASLPHAIPLRPIAAILSDLSRPLPKECLGSLPRKNKQTGQITHIPFAPWPTVAAILDAYAPGWEGCISRVERVGDKLATYYRLTIHALEGDFSQEDGAFEDEDTDDYGDAVTNGIATAFKRAAAKFGVERHLYAKPVTAVPLAAYLKAERIAALADLGAAVDAAGLDRAATVAWLRSQTGASSNAMLSIAAIKSLTLHLEG